MSTYAWIIDKDHLYPEGEEGVYSGPGITGPRNAPDELVAKLKAGEGEKFRMYDDDGELYYEGRIVFVDEAMKDGLDAFGPLDDYGTPNAGATHIKYRDPATKEWNQL